MGCDIHLFVEVRTENGWEAVDPPKDAPSEKYADDPDYFSRWGNYHKYRDESTTAVQWSFGRNYRCFALLADVRNDGNVQPIAEAKGLPADVTDAVLGEYVCNGENLDADVIARYRGYGSTDTRLGLSNPDWHSASSHTLADLERADGNAVCHNEGWVTPEEYTRWKEKGAPDAWCKSVGGGNVQHVTHHDMDEYIADPNHIYRKLRNSVYTLIQWDVPVSAYTTRLAELVEKLREVAAERGVSHDDVRIVFWFDN